MEDCLLLQRSKQLIDYNEEIYVHGCGYIFKGRKRRPTLWQVKRLIYGAGNYPLRARAMHIY
jgi:hypothetical protein